MAIEKVKITDTNVIEQIRNSLPTATNEKKVCYHLTIK